VNNRTINHIKQVNEYYSVGEVMKKIVTKPIFIVIALFLVIVISKEIARLPEAKRAENQTSKSEPQEVKRAYEPTGKITFYELGSEGCAPCEAMKPVMKLVRESYGDSVDVIFHDLKKDVVKAGVFQVMLIPTQVFADDAGKEFYRHQGFLTYEKLEEVLLDMGAKPDGK
jgi:thioredoxin 1